MPRRAYEAGHRPKILVVVDGTPECERALYFASRRAKRLCAGIVTAAIITPQEGLTWRGIGDLVQAEAEEEAEFRLEAAAKIIAQEAGSLPQKRILTGDGAEELKKLIEEDEDVVVLILAAATGGEGPGPLISLLFGALAAHFPVPIMIVPAGLSDAEFDALG